MNNPRCMLPGDYSFKTGTKNLLTKRNHRAIISKHSRDARVVELADSLDSGSSAHSGRAGSSPASRTTKKPLAA